MEIISQETRKAHKEHQCDWCYGVIEKGETYDHASCKQDGDVYTWKNHKRCMEIAHELRMFDECDDYGLDSDSFVEYINEYYFRLIDENDTTVRTFSERLDFVCNIKLKNK